MNRKSIQWMIFGYLAIKSPLSYILYTLPYSVYHELYIGLTLIELLTIIRILTILNYTPHEKHKKD